MSELEVPLEKPLEEDLSEETQVLSDLGQQVTKLILIDRGIPITDAANAEIAKICVFSSYKEFVRNVEKHKIIRSPIGKLTLKIAAFMNGDRKGGNFMVLPYSETDVYRLHIQMGDSTNKQKESMFIHELVHVADLIIGKLGLGTQSDKVLDELESANRANRVRMLTENITMLCVLATVISVLLKDEGYRLFYSTTALIGAIASIISLGVYWRTPAERRAREGSEKYADSQQFSQALSRLADATFLASNPQYRLIERET